MSFSRCASTRASASLTRCFSLLISSDVDIQYLQERVRLTRIDQSLRPLSPQCNCCNSRMRVFICFPNLSSGKAPKSYLSSRTSMRQSLQSAYIFSTAPVSRPSAGATEGPLSANSRLVPATSLGSSAVHPPDLKLRRLLEFLASKPIPQVWTDLEGR